MEEKGPRRLYSICSGELEEEIHILYKVVDEGFLTPQLSDLEIGNTIWITAPGGEFTGDKDPAVWIATGTGIAPFYSMNSRRLLARTTSGVAAPIMTKRFTRGGLPDTWRSRMP